MNNTVISVLGMKGSGKSTLVKEIIQEFPRVIVIDTMGEYPKAIVGKRECVRKILSLRGKSRFRIACQILDKEETLEVLRFAYEIENVLIVVEETSYYCSPSHLPEAIALLVRFGRHRRISQIYVARRPSELPRDLTANSDILVTFRQQEPKDLEYLRSYMGKAGNEAASLPKYAILAHGDLEDAPEAILSRMRKKLTAGPPED